MPSDRVRQALCDMRENAALARDFVGAMTLKEFSTDRRTFYAVTRCLEIISEAARRLDDDLRARRRAPQRNRVCCGKGRWQYTKFIKNQHHNQ
jgi:uncharacterized protein with HEPN domain